MKPVMLLALVFLLLIAGCAAVGAPQSPSFDFDCTKACAEWWARPDRNDTDRAAVRCECRTRAESICTRARAQ